MTTDELRISLLTLSPERAAASPARVDRFGPSIDHRRAGIASRPHVFSTPVVREIARPAEPVWSASAW